MNYTNYKSDDFAKDPSFREWVLNKEARATAFWTFWLLQHPEKQQEVEEAKALLFSFEFRRYTTSAKRKKQTRQNIERFVQQRQRTKKLYYGMLWLSAAVLLIALLSWNYLEQQKPVQYVATNTVHHIVLDDGTVVSLNKGAVLTVPKTWAKNNQRDVQLDGEAYFDVAHDASKPFVVTTKQGFIQVLGTQFNVDTDSASLDVVLTEGSVAFTSPADTSRWIMKPGQRLLVDSTTTFPLLTHLQSTALFSSWMKDFVQLDEVPLSEIVEWYANEHHLQCSWKQESLKTLMLSGSVPTKNTKMFLSAIARALNVKIDQTNDQIIISPTTKI